MYFKLIEFQLPDHGIKTSFEFMINLYSLIEVVNDYVHNYTSDAVQACTGRVCALVIMKCTAQV